MQQAVWDSIANGRFVDAKIFAYSRCDRESGRVHTPRPLFVNTHVLANACSFFRSSMVFLFSGDLPLSTIAVFDLTDGVETSIPAGLPEGLDTALDLEGNNSNDDYDVDGEDSDDDRVASKAPAPILQKRTVKAYLVKYTAYRTSVRDCEVYISTDGNPACAQSSGTSIRGMSFSPPLALQTHPSHPPRLSIDLRMRFVPLIINHASWLRLRQHGMDHLKSLAFSAITVSICKMERSRLIQAAFTPLASQ